MEGTTEHPETGRRPGGPATGTITLLFTDIVGSTALFDRLGDDRAEAVRREHFRVVREAITSRGGEEVKSLGDGLMVAFASALDALSAAVAVQRAVARHNRLHPDAAAAVRVGLHVGEPIREDEDFFGTPVIVARRLCDSAESGQIVASALVRDLVGSRGGFDFRAIGEVELRGLSHPITACDVVWQTAVRDAVTLPAALSLDDRRPFVGRDVELATLVDAWQKAQSASRQVLLIAGEPGIGKTRLCAELAERTRVDGGLVLYGRCDEETIVPYQPFVEALRHLARAAPRDELRRHVETASTVLGRLVPELDPLASTQAAVDDPETERYRLFEAVAELICGVSCDAPAVLVLDDLHWADRPTLLLLRHLLRAELTAALLVLGTYRDTDLVRTHPLSEMLADLRRSRQATRISLSGLDVGEVRSMIAASAGHGVRADFAAAIHRETDGNPFFIEETIAHLIESGVVFMREGRWTFDIPVEEMGIPEGVRDVVGRRLSRLSEPCNRALTHAAVLGRDFEFDVLRSIAGLDDEVLVEALEEAVEHRVIAEAEATSASGARYSFSHALIKQTLYEELTLPRKQRLHLRAAQAIEAVHGRDLDPRIGALALHYRLAGAAADPGKAFDYSVRAGQAARGVAAWEEAAEHWGAALEIAADEGLPAAQVAGLQERLGTLLYNTGIDHPGGIAHHERALGTYQALGDEMGVARTRSRLGIDLVSVPSTQDIPRALEHLRAAEAVFTTAGDQRSLGYVKVGIAFTCLWGGRFDEIEDVTSSTLELASLLGDEGLWCQAASARAWCLMCFGRFNESVALAEEAWRRSERVRLPFGLYSSAWTAAATKGFLLGDLETGHTWLQRALDHPLLRGAVGQRALLRELMGVNRVHAGDVDEARRLLFELGPLLYGHLEAMIEEYFGDEERGLQLMSGLIEQRRSSGDRWDECFYLAERANVLAIRGEREAAETDLNVALAISAPVMEMWIRFRLAILCADSGRVAEARAHAERLETLTANGEDWRALRGLSQRAAAAACYAAGDMSGAENAFAGAAEVFARFGIRWREADTLHDWGRFRLATGDTARGRERLEEAAQLYTQLQAGPGWLARVEADLAR